MGCAAGCLACALLVVNNLRDIPTDTAAGKRTLAVRLGDARHAVALRGAARRGAFVLVVVAGGRGGRAVAAGAASAVAARPCRRSGPCSRGARGPALIPVLGATGRLQLAFGAPGDARPRCSAR